MPAAAGNAAAAMSDRMLADCTAVLDAMILTVQCFLQEPPAQQMMNKQPVEFDQAINYVNKIKVGCVQSSCSRNSPAGS